MRSLCAMLVFAIALLGSTAALAEKRIFIIANSPDAYGVDRCLATGASCGAAANASIARYAARSRSGVRPADMSAGSGCAAAVIMRRGPSRVSTATRRRAPVRPRR